MAVKALFSDIVLDQPGFDELRNNLHGLVVRIRDESDRGININFGPTWQYTHADESYAYLLAKPLKLLSKPGISLHWLYEVSESENFSIFKTENPHHPPDIKEFIVVLDNDLISVIGKGPVTISERTDGIRSFWRAGEPLGEPDSSSQISENS